MNCRELQNKSDYFIDISFISPSEKSNFGTSGHWAAYHNKQKDT